MKFQIGQKVRLIVELPEWAIKQYDPILQKVGLINCKIPGDMWCVFYPEVLNPYGYKYLDKQRSSFDKLCWVVQTEHIVSAD